MPNDDHVHGIPSFNSSPSSTSRLVGGGTPSAPVTGGKSGGRASAIGEAGLAIEERRHAGIVGTGKVPTSANGQRAPELHAGVADEPEPHVINPLGVHLRTDPARGRGVFAATDIAAGMTIDESPVLLITREHWEQGKMDDSVLGEYGFCWSNGGMAIGLGLASLFNHAPSPNVNYIRDAKAGVIRFRTVRRVAAGEELCICYAADESKLWFTPQYSGAPDTPGPHAAADNVADEDADLLSTFAAAMDVDVERAAQAAAQRIAEREARRAAAGPKNAHKAKRQSKARDKRAAAVTPPLPGDPVSYLPPGYHNPRDKHETTDPGDAPMRHAHVGPVILTDPLPFDETLGSTSVAEADWPLLRRVEGPADLEEEVDLEDMSTMDVWVAEFTDASLTGKLLGLVNKLYSDVKMKHVRRVWRTTDEAGQDKSLVMVCLVEDVDVDVLRRQLADHDARLGGIALVTRAVPCGPARTPEQVEIKNAQWPVSYVASPPAPPTDARVFSAQHLAWIRAGIARVLADAAAAEARGELPVAMYCASPPEALWPAPPSAFIAPTRGLRAAAHDTRVSEAHPLRHAALNGIAAVARLRTVEPFASQHAARNGADYLLTSMTAFLTHEPCVMCAMALLHSRVRQVFYVHSSKSGGFEAAYGVHARKDLNHRFDVWQWQGDGVPHTKIADGIEI